MILCGTGHRPDKLAYGYQKEGIEFLASVAEAKLIELKPDEVVTGMALGWDTALAIAALRLEIPLTAAIPFEGQEKAWPASSQKIFNRILEKITRKEIICEGEYAAWKMMTRNKWMVDNSDKVLALWNGSEGGTGNCVKYANEKQKEIINCWELYESMLPPWDV